MREALGLIVAVIMLCLLFEPEATAKRVGDTWHTFVMAAYPATCAKPQ